jgi:uncharacterized repeat protein (TIGR02543 family)
VFHFGDETNHMYFTPSNADGRAEFVIREGNTVRRLTAQAPLPVGRWTIVTISIIGNTGTLTFNTGPAALGAVAIPTVTSADITLTPAQVATSGVYSLGRSTNGNFFNGSYDYFNIFFKAVPAPEYIYTETEDTTPPPPLPIVTFNHNYEGSSEPTTAQVRENRTLATSSLPTLTRDGFTFDGWFTSSVSGEGERIRGGREGTVFADDTTVYARWTELDIPVEILTLYISGASADENGGWFEIRNPTDNILSSVGLVVVCGESEWRIPSVIFVAGMTLRVRAYGNDTCDVLKRMRANFAFEVGDSLLLNDFNGVNLWTFDVES